MPAGRERRRRVGHASAGPPRRRGLHAALCLLAVATACSRPSRGGTAELDLDKPYVSNRCPLPDGARGYPITAVALGESSLDPAWLTALARTVAYRWRVPTRLPSQHAGFASLTASVLPDAPRWAGDWKPSARHRAEVVVRIGPSGVVGEPETRSTSGDPLFDESLLTFHADPVPATPRLPSPPVGGADTVRVLLRFGGEPQPGERTGVVRFARQQREVRIMPPSLLVRLTPNERAVVKYDVGTDGRVVPASLHMIQSSSEGFARAVERALYARRFPPAQGDCAPIRVTVVQVFGLQ